LAQPLGVSLENNKRQKHQYQKWYTIKPQFKFSPALFCRSLLSAAARRQQRLFTLVLLLGNCKRLNFDLQLPANLEFSSSCLQSTYQKDPARGISCD
jgi:hypothetical protein